VLRVGESVMVQAGIVPEVCSEAPDGDDFDVGQLQQRKVLRV